MGKQTYIAIDLKSFYASVECMERGLDPLATNLVVADPSRTEKTICLAVSPSLKAYGVPGRPRLFEVVQKVKEVNQGRRQPFEGSSHDAGALKGNPRLAVDYITAPPQMALYMAYSARIYDIYLKYIAPEDIHVYSVDEVFMDVTHYLGTYKMTAHELAMKMIRDVLRSTGITATAGIGTNLYLCKIAMDIVAKKMPADKDGVRIAELDEMSYRRQLWDHRPLTDFWRVGRGYTRKLEANGLYTMGDIARCSLGKPSAYHNADLLFTLFGVNAELLIDHAWGWEPCTMGDIKTYRPQCNSLGSGQVLASPYTVKKARLIVREMTDQLILDLVDKGLVTDQVVLTIGYDMKSLEGAGRRAAYQGEVTTDHYGRRVPRHAHGTANLPRQTASAARIMDAVMKLYERIINPDLLVRRVTITACHVVREDQVPRVRPAEQLDMFVDYEARRKQEELEAAAAEREKRIQQAILSVKRKYGKNAIMKGISLEEGATAMDRNNQIGGHRA